MKKLRQQWRQVLISLSALECLLVVLCYTLRPDWATAVTIFPFWLWSIPGLMLAAVAVPHRAAREVKLVRRIVLAGWLVIVYMIAEEPRSLMRPVGDLAKSSGRGSWRIISLNCAGGDPAAAAETVPLRPDFVLLQESPTEQHLKHLASQTWGSDRHYIAGMDTAILSRWPLERIDLPRELRGSFLCAEVLWQGGPPIELISLRLTAAVLRWDLWSPSCWSDQTQNRQVRREQLNAFLAHLRAIPPDTIVILGGDFNAPQGDPVIGILGPELHDAFAEAGRGWGNTIPDEWPLLRIDQIWLSRNLHAGRTFALQTTHSDHRMAVVDIDTWQ